MNLIKKKEIEEQHRLNIIAQFEKDKKQQEEYIQKLKNLQSI